MAFCNRPDMRSLVDRDAEINYQVNRMVAELHLSGKQTRAKTGHTTLYDMLIDAMAAPYEPRNNNPIDVVPTPNWCKRLTISIGATKTKEWKEANP